MDQQSPRDVVYTEVFLNPRQFARLKSWVWRPTMGTKNGNNGGMQRRRLDWRDRLNEATHSIRLTTHSSSVRETEDDVTWIRKTMVNKNKGGFQSHIFFMFEDTHPAFSNIKVLPRVSRAR